MMERTGCHVRRAAAGILLAGLLLGGPAGCGSLVDLKPSGPPPARYLLNAPTPAGVGGKADAALVLVSEPMMPRALATDGIAVREGRWRFAYLAGARWGDRAPVMIARLLRRTLDAMPRVVALSGDETGISAAWRLSGEVDGFEIETAAPGGPPQRVRVAIDLRLFRLHPTRLVAERRFAHVQPIAGAADAGAAVAAFQQAFDAIERDLQEWLSDRLRAAGAGGPPAGE